MGGTGLVAWLVTGFDIAGIGSSGFASKVLPCFFLIIFALVTEYCY